MFELISPRGNVKVGESIRAHLRYINKEEILPAGAFIRIGFNKKDGAYLGNPVQESDYNSFVEVEGNARLCREPALRRSIIHLYTTGVSDLWVLDIEITGEGLRQGEAIDIYLGGNDPSKSFFCPGTMAGDVLEFFYHIDPDGKYPLVSLHKDAVNYMQYISPDGKSFPQWRSCGISINLSPDYPRHVDLVLPTKIETGVKSEMRVVIYDRFYNFINDYEGTVDIVEPEDAERKGISFKPSAFNTGKQGYATVPVTFTEEGTFAGVVFRVAELGIAEVNPVMVGAREENKIFWGELHGHSNLSDGGALGSDAFFQYARDIRGLDFAALADHSFGLAVKDNWEQLKESVKKFTDEEKFIPVLGYEIMTNGYGHRNIYFPGESGKLLMADYQRGSGGSFCGESLYAYAKIWNSSVPKTATIEEFLKALKGVEFIYTAHHCGDVTEIERPILTLYEACSEWGISEEGIRYNRFTETIENIFAQRLSPGFTGGSDDHTARAGFIGNSRLTPGGPIRYSSGLTAVLCRNLDRQSIYQALCHKLCYATTGARIILEPRVRREEERLEIILNIVGTALLDRIWIYKNGKEVFHRYCVSDFEDKLNWQDTSFGAKDVCYVRISQMDGHIAWINPLPFASLNENPAPSNL